MSSFLPAARKSRKWDVIIPAWAQRNQAVDILAVNHALAVPQMVVAHLPAVKDAPVLVLPIVKGLLPAPAATIAPIAKQIAATHPRRQVVAVVPRGALQCVQATVQLLAKGVKALV